MSKLKNVLVLLSMCAISENALLDGIVRTLEGREAFKDADCNNNERIYHGDVFGAILEEQEGMSEATKLPKKVLKQLEELNKIIDTDYVLVTLS